MRIDFQPTGPCPSHLMIVGEAPGEREVVEHAPFVGPSGWELDRLLRQSGMNRSEAFVTNVLRERPPNNDIAKFITDRKTSPGAEWVRIDGLWVRPEVAAGRELLLREVAECQPNVIIAFGNLALWALTGNRGIKKWRGSILRVSPGGHACKVIPSYHPAFVLRQWSIRPTVIRDIERVKAELDSPLRPEPAYRHIVRPTFGQVEEFFANVAQVLADNGAIRLAPDIETAVYHIESIAFAWSKLDAICIPFMTRADHSGYWSLEEEAWIVHQLHLMFNDPRIDFVGQNWLYDAQYIWRRWKTKVARVRDTMIAQHTMFSTGQKSLDYLASLYAEDYVFWKDEGKTVDPKIPEDVRWAYNCKDCCYTYEVDDGQAEARESMTPSWPKLPEIHAFQQGLFHPVLRTMNKGIRANKVIKSSFAQSLMAAAKRRNEYIQQVCSQPLNVGSNPQMCDFFYHQLGQRRILKRTNPGEPMRETCDDAALQLIGEREPMLRPLVRTMQELRSVRVYQSNFINMKLDEDDRIRCSIGIAATKSYRFNARKSAFDTGANLQTIPTGNEEEDMTLAQRADALPNVKLFFCPDLGRTIFDIDLDSADARIVAGESNCAFMKEIFRQGKKLYVEIAKEYLHDPSITKAHSQYRTFKALCHGTHYLGGGPGLAHNTGLLVHEVDRIQKWYFGLCPEIKIWHERIKAQVDHRGWIENAWGYRCYFFDRISDDTYKEAVAWIPQSTVANLIDRGYVEIDRALPWCDILMQVHDSLLGQFPSHMGKQAERAILDACTIPIPYPDPIIIPVGLKTSTISWGDCA